MNDVMLRIDNVSKQYRLGQIGGTTLRDELQRWSARRRGLDDPTKKIGARDYQTGETFMALDDVTLDVARGERVGIIGRNGAGKSTLLKLISRVTAPTSGTITLNGRVASMLEVSTGFHPELTGRENIFMNGAILGMTRREIDAKMEDIIEFSECRQFIDTPVKRYSSGMYVKLAFSVAAHLDSEIMIMDEVLAVGDMAFQKKCLQKMSDVSNSQGRTILYVSHNMNTIRQLCERVVVLNQGKIEFNGGVEEGIALYLGNGADGLLPTTYDFTSVSRVYHFGHEIFIKSLCFIKSDTAKFDRNDPVVLEIHMSSNIKREKVRIIVRIKDKYDNAKIAGCLSEPFDVEPTEDMQVRLEMNISNLISDDYMLSLEAIQRNNTAGYHSYDNPGVAVPIRVFDGRTGERTWSTQYWGSIRLPNGRIRIGT